MNKIDFSTILNYNDIKLGNLFMINSIHDPDHIHLYKIVEKSKRIIY